MFKFNNNHIFTGYLKQLLSSVNIPMCKIYTTAFENYLIRTGKEDPRIVESFDIVDSDNNKKAIRVNYLKNNEIFNFNLPYNALVGGGNIRESGHWNKVSSLHYDKDIAIPGLTKVLKSPGTEYDTTTHEYLGDYLRFIRDYYNINLMSMYNCFNNKPCNNIFYELTFGKNLYITANSLDTSYTIYSIPVRLFSNYTIAIDSNCGVELFCGLYSGKLDAPSNSPEESLIVKTYKKMGKTIFNQPFLYDGLSVENWSLADEIVTRYDGTPELANTITRNMILNREQDLRLFIKVPKTCRSSIVVLEGDYRRYNDCLYNYNTNSDAWIYKQNHIVTNYSKPLSFTEDIVPISKLQLLALNTGVSYPFADRLVEYLARSAITPIDEIPDNIKRVQKVLAQNGHKFGIEGLWYENIQRIIYDYIMTAGPFEATDTGIKDKGQGYIKSLGHRTKSDLYDILGYVDKDAEKWYASWKKNKNTGKVEVVNTIQNVDIYNGLYDI